MARSQYQKARQEELAHIREDLNSLRDNVVALTQTLEEEVVDAASVKAHELGAKSKKAVTRVEKKIKQNPGQSVLAAFGTGFLISMLLNNRH